MKLEGFVHRHVQLFQDVDGEVPMNDKAHICLQAQVYPGHDEDEPITIVCSQENQGKAGTPQPENEALVSPVDSSLLTRIRGGTTWNLPTRLASFQIQRDHVHRWGQNDRLHQREPAYPL